MVPADQQRDAPIQPSDVEGRDPRVDSRGRKLDIHSLRQTLVRGWPGTVWGSGRSG